MDVLSRIGALLAKSEGTDNEHERDAYLSKAQQLATLHAVDLARARASAPLTAPRETPVRRRVEVGPPRALGNRALIRLYAVIARHNDVRVDVVHDSTAVHAFGMPADLEVVAAMYGSLAHQMVQAGNAYVTGRTWAGEVSVGSDGFMSPTNARRARVHFYDGYTMRIDARLGEARADAVRTAETASSSAVVGVAVVLRDRAAAVGDFYARTSEARGRWSGSAPGPVSDSTARGYAAGAHARLTTPTALGA